jgi:hypothetical protein
MADVSSDGMTRMPGSDEDGAAAANATPQLASLHVGAAEGGDVAEEASSAGGEEDWLLCAVVVSGKGLYVGDGTLGDLFCMLHTSDGVCRSRTAVTGMVYSNASPCWPSNGNGNAFVLPVRRSDRETHLVVTVWDGSESLEEAIPVGKVHVRLSSFMAVPAASVNGGQRDEAPPKYEYDVDLVPRLAELSQGEAKLTLMLERAEPAFELESAKDQALADLLRRLAMARKKDRLKRLMQWDREYVGHGNSRQHQPHSRDYSLVALLTQDPAAENGGPEGRPVGGRPSDAASEASDIAPPDGAAPSLDSSVHVKAPLEGMVEMLSEGQGAGRGRLVSAPVRAQAELLSRLKYVTLEDGDVVKP